MLVNGNDTLISGNFQFTLIPKFYIIWLKDLQILQNNCCLIKSEFVHKLATIFPSKFSIVKCIFIDID